MTSDDHTQLWTAYMEAFGEPDPGKRERLLETAVSDGVIFTNPGGHGASRVDLVKHIGAFQSQMPSMHFRTDALHAHHGELLAVWSMYKADDTKVTTGYNLVRCDDDGRFNYMAGFF